MSEHYTEDDSVLLVVEGRAAAPSWLAHLGAPPPSGWSVLEQEEWEPVSPFLDRLGDTLARNAFDGEHAETVVVVLGADLDETGLAARRLVLLSVMTELARQGSGTVLLTHGLVQDARLHEELCELADELASEWEDSGVAVHARFEGAPRRAELRKTGDTLRPFVELSERAVI
ncbi:MAG TPA: hypothetical protein VHE30_27970 [Polyangiaceae bacterium]|nr:hypothetical protein [Polyangiaceae bacterium]